jgi:hypothetical protein
MGVRIDAYAVDLPRFAAFLNTTLGDLLRRYQLDGKDPGERLMFTSGHDCDTFFATPGGSIRAWLGSGSDRHVEELTEERIRTIDALQSPAYEHLSKDIYQSSRLLEGFSDCRGIDFIERLTAGHRRWWVGSVLQFADTCFERSEYDTLELLFRKSCGARIAATRFKTATRASLRTDCRLRPRTILISVSEGGQKRNLLSPWRCCPG